MCDVQFKVVNNIQSYFPWYLISYMLQWQEVSLWRFVHNTVVMLLIIPMQVAEFWKKNFNFGGHLFVVTRDLNVRIQLGKPLFWIQHIQIM